jgi:hypothetical protein
MESQQPYVTATVHRSSVSVQHPPFRYPYCVELVWLWNEGYVVFFLCTSMEFRYILRHIDGEWIKNLFQESYGSSFMGSNIKNYKEHSVLETSSLATL